MVTKTCGENRSPEDTVGEIEILLPTQDGLFIFDGEAVRTKLIAIYIQIYNYENS